MKKRRRKNRRLRTVATLAVGAALLTPVGAATLLWRWANDASDDAGTSDSASRRFEVGTNERFESVASRLETEGRIDSGWRLSLYAQLTRAGDDLQRGEHLLPRGLSPAQLLACLVRGHGRPRVKLTIPEGYDRFQVAARLDSLAITPGQRFSRAAADGPRLREMGVAADTAEGYLFPATYRFYVDEPPTAVLARLVLEARRRHDRIASKYEASLARLKELHGWSMHDVVTLASIVEREAADPGEHGPIASVFHNRLEDDAFRPRRRLQSDPTAAYGCRLLGDAVDSCRGFSGEVTARMLRDPDNPYNTYRHAGLPPGPISNPGESAIEAALQPPVTPYFFFVSRDGKRHVFTRTLDEHRRAIGGDASSARDR